MSCRILQQKTYKVKMTLPTPLKMGLPRLRKMHLGYFDDTTPALWDAIILYDEKLGIKIGTAAEPTALVREVLCDHVPTVLADVIIQYCRRIDFRTILDLTHPSNMDVQELLLSYGCNMTP